MGKAPWIGEYRLYTVPPPKPNVLDGGKLLATVHLNKGVPLGFRRTNDGGVVAVAGDKEIPVSDGKYEWVMLVDPGQTDPVATAVFIIVVVVVVVGVAALIYGLDQQRKVNHFFK